jgi:hypothetical protein
VFREVTSTINTAAKRIEVPSDILNELRSICLGFPETYEEQAWVGTRWLVGHKSLAHVLGINAGWPPAYARAAGSNGPVYVLTFRTDLEPRTLGEYPFFYPGWFPNIVGMVLDDDVDWIEIGELLKVSYCVMAPKKLAALVA